MRMLFAGGASADEFATPDLDAGEEEEEEEYYEEHDAIDEEGSADDAELVRDELADLEGLIQAAKVKS